MKSIYEIFLAFFTASEAVLIWLILMIGFDMGFFPAAGLSILAGGLTFLGVKWGVQHKYLKKNKLTRKEYAYIQKNMAEAKKKVARLQKALFAVRTVGSFRQLYELNRLVKRMYGIVKKEPRRFYQSERFFFYHLDSIVEISERYAYLAAQPVKNDQIYLSLKQTQHTLEDLHRSIKKDIYQVLESDVDDLQFELDVARHSLKKLEYHPLDEERGTKQ